MDTDCRSIRDDRQKNVGQLHCSTAPTGAAASGGLQGRTGPVPGDERLQCRRCLPALDGLGLPPAEGGGGSGEELRSHRGACHIGHYGQTGRRVYVGVARSTGFLGTLRRAASRLRHLPRGRFGGQNPVETSNREQGTGVDNNKVTHPKAEWITYTGMYKFP